MDTSFAKIVTDLEGRDHILIEGRIISLQGATSEVNVMVDCIVRGLRTQYRDFGCAINSAAVGGDQQTAGVVAAAVGA